jgi:ferredoxin-NADP reductase
VRRRFTGWDLSVLAAANAAVVVGLWLRQGGVTEIHDGATLLTSLGRVTGLLGAYLALVELLLLARVPGLDAVGLDRVGRWHRFNGTACLGLLVAHTVLITAGYAVGADVPLGRQIGDLLADYYGVLLATVGLALFVAAVGTSVVAVRRRLGHRAWHAIHVTVYAAVALAFAHQLATGQDFHEQPVARAYWWVLYGATLAALLWVRVLAPVARAWRHDLRVARVVEEGPGVVSIEIGGRNLDRLPVLAGHHLHWRFLAGGHWWESRPFSLSAAPDGRRLRITVRGDHAALHPGTRVLAEGPAGGFTRAERRDRVALIAGGAGIAPVRALLEDLPGDIAVIYLASDEREVLFRSELDELAARRGAALHYVLDGPLSPERLRALVPDVAEREVFVCGPTSMTETTRASLRRAGVPARRIVTEGFG